MVVLPQCITSLPNAAHFELAKHERQSQAVELLRTVGPLPRLAEALREWADLLVSQQRHAEAVGLLQEALRG